MLVRQGLAVVYKGGGAVYGSSTSSNSNSRHGLEGLEKQAKKNGRGMWAAAHTYSASSQGADTAPNAIDFETPAAYKERLRRQK